ncbi:Gfo/Idh/MocA family oxidoreductase [Shigella flexneri]
MFNDPNIDPIVIPTPTITHFPVSQSGALAGGKHVVVDKPFTVTLSQARAWMRLQKAWGACRRYS